MKTIYTKENFMHINSEYPLKTFSVFFDDVQYDLELKDAEDYLNIPIHKYSYISFPKQFAKYVAISNARRLTEEKKELYDELGFKKYKEITFLEVETGTPDNLVILFTETDEYLDLFQDVAINNLKPNTKLIVLKDDYLQYGSNFLFRNNGELLIESLESFIQEKTEYFEAENVTIIGSRTGAKQAQVYSSLFPDFKLITFNTEYSNMKKEDELYAINTYGIKFANSLEFTTYSENKLTAEQRKEKSIVVNTKSYSFEEMMRLTLYYALINNSYKEEVNLAKITIDLSLDTFELPPEINAQPLMIFFKQKNILRTLDTYSYGGEYRVKTAVLQNENLSSGTLNIITENKKFILECGVNHD